MKAANKDECNKLTLEWVLEELVRWKIISATKAREIFEKKKLYKFHPLNVVASCNIPDRRKANSFVGVEDLYKWLAEVSSVEYYEIDPLKIDISAITGVLSQKFLKRLKILPVEVTPRSITFVTSEPFDRHWVFEIADNLKKEIKIKLANAEMIDRCIDGFFSVHAEVSKMSREHAESSEVSLPTDIEKMMTAGNTQAVTSDSSVAKIMDWLFSYANDERATDIHIEPQPGKGRIRFRIDGRLRVVYHFDPVIMVPLIARVKILAKMKVDEKRRPQDGRIKRELSDKRVMELRIATIPTPYGEKVVIRIFDSKTGHMTFDSLGFYKRDIKEWSKLIANPNGIILVTGPTGSGKSTTLHTSLRQIATDEVNVCTVEDPIEILNTNFNQVEVNTILNITFGNTIRAFLRQDPDIIMVGEIRDSDACDMAIQASLTGHLVLSTLHTNDALSSVIRLLDLGIPVHLINATVRGILAQRLARTLCDSCKEKIRTPKDQWKALVRELKIEIPPYVFVPKGCSECKHVGFKGRQSVYELLPYSEKLKTLVKENITLQELENSTRGDFVTMRENGARRIIEGTTSLDEIMRIIY
ncbi:MAG: type II/IV secretion system protein [Bacteriovoracaceae bacterium]|nr:type II/IV secretion system protein [Bacteriovoracaceae bacterium]